MRGSGLSTEKQQITQAFLSAILLWACLLQKERKKSKIYNNNKSLNFPELSSHFSWDWLRRQVRLRKARAIVLRFLAGFFFFSS